MKSLYLLVCLVFTLLSFSQTKLSSSLSKESIQNNTKDDKNIKKHRFVIYPGCENDDDKYECFANKLQDFIANNIGKTTVNSLISSTNEDTIVFYANIKYDKNGSKIAEKSRLISFVKGLDESLIHIKNSLPKVDPALDYKGRPTSNSVALTLGFQIDKKNKTIKPLYGYQPELKPEQYKLLEVVEKPPVHPNCDEDADRTKINECINSNISQFIIKNFNQKILSTIHLPEGKYIIIATFKIDKNGKVIVPEAKGPNKVIEQETIRILNLLPKFKPGSIRGAPIIFPYSLPIVFEVKANPTSKN